MRNPKILVLDRGAELLKEVQMMASELRPRPDVIACERLGSVGEMLSNDGPFDVLVAGPSLGTKAGLSRLQVIHDELPGMSMVLAFSSRPDAQLRDIVRAGAMDLLQLPVSEKVLHDAIERAVEVAHHRPAIVPASAPHAPAQLPAKQAQVFTVASATGGCGKTFFATNLAYFLHHNTGKRVCIVDLDLQFGEVSTALRLRPRFTIFDALQRDEGEESGDLPAKIEDYLVTHDTGVHVLAAPKDPSDADRIHPPDVTKIIESLRSTCDYLIVDTPAALTEIVLAAFDLSNDLYVMATLDLPSVRNMSVFLNTLEKLKIPADNVRLILNKAEKDVGIDIDQVTRLFPQGFSAVLPYAREVSKSVNVGTPILAFSPGSEVSRRMETSLIPLLPEENRDRASAAAQKYKAPARGPFSFLFRRNRHSHES
ncbi:MAG TPA: AAA family ATPase [Acidimicrobiales bacterium]|nr:AAA family ATPase [Acidimicrobiales bacterium]